MEGSAPLSSGEPGRSGTGKRVEDATVFRASYCDAPLWKVDGKRGAVRIRQRSRG